MTKSVTALICGLIGSLFSLWWGFTFGLFGNLLNIIPAEEAANIGQTLTVLGWIAFFGAIVGIVGASLSAKKAMPSGAICLSIATIFCGILQIYLFVKTLTPDFVMTGIVIFLIPTVLLAVSAIFDWLAKDVKDRADLGVPPMVAQQQQPEQPEQKPAEKTLEQELTELKNMVEKGLLTEEEYAEAKKGVLAKHSK